MPLNKKQIKKAARLYSLALVAHLDGGDTEEQDAVKTEARRAATEALTRLGFEPGELTTLENCINAAKSE
jgi:hypothetical protein